MHAGNNELGLMHLVSELVNLVRGIAEDDCLTDGCSFKDIDKGVKLRLFLLNINEKLFDAVIGIVLSVHIDCESNSLGPTMSRPVHTACHHSKDESGVSIELFCLAVCGIVAGFRAFLYCVKRINIQC